MSSNLQHQFESSAVGFPEQDIHKVCMFVVHDNDLLCVVREHKDGTASVESPGGKVDIKPCGTRETVEEALVREAAEELNIQINPVAFIGVEPHPFSGKPVGYYMCEHVSGEPINNLEDEHLGILRIPLTDFDAIKDNLAREGWGGRKVDYRIPDNLLTKALYKSDEQGLASGQHYNFG